MDGVKEEVIDEDCTLGVDTGLVVKQEAAWSMEEDSPDQPSAVYSTVQPMADNTSGSLLSLKRGRVCPCCSAAFVLVSSLELHLASVHGEPLPFPEWTESRNRQKQKAAWSMEEDSPDQPSAVYITAQPMSDNTSWSLLSLKRGRMCHCCSAAFVLVSSLELHLASVHGEPLPFPEWTESSDRQRAAVLQPTSPPNSTLTSSVGHKSGSTSGSLVSLCPPSTHTNTSGSLVSLCPPSTHTNTSGSLVFLNISHKCNRCSGAFVLFSSLKFHAQFVHKEKMQAEPPAFTIHGSFKVSCSERNRGKEGAEASQAKGGERQKHSLFENVDDSSTKDGKKRDRRHVCDVCSRRS